MILEKSETKNKFSVDDSQSKEVVSTSVDMPQETIEISSEVTQESGETFNSQETILDYELYSNVYDNQTPENNAVEKRVNLSASFPGKLDNLDSICLSEYRKSNQI